MRDSDKPPWTLAPVVAPEPDDEADSELITQVFQRQLLPAHHPIARAWNTASAKSRHVLHQLADDSRLLRGTPGFGDLCKKIRTDIDGFEDSAYELRVAGSLARGKGQEVLRLGGSKQGPDIVFRAQSGHDCGVACYRARSSPPDILAIKPLVNEVVTGFSRLYGAWDFGSNAFFHIRFPEFPIRVQDAATALRLLGQLWSAARPQRAELDGVSGRRIPLPPGVVQGGDFRRVRVRLEFHVTEWDRRRVFATVRQKMNYESKRWAADFKGLPIFAVEESDGAHGGRLPEDLKGLMSEPNTFVGILLTHYPANGLEHVQWVPRQTGDLGLHIHIETLFNNTHNYAAGRPLVSFSTGTAFIDHDFRTRRRHGAKKREVMQMGKFRSEWPAVRLPPMGDFTTATKDPRFMPAVQKAFEVLRDQQERLGPLDHVNEVIDLVFEE